MPDDVWTYVDDLLLPVGRIHADPHAGRIRRWPARIAECADDLRRALIRPW